MKKRIRLLSLTAPPVPLIASTAFVGTTALVVMSSPAHADVVGRLRIVVKNADTQKPVPGVKITVTDPSGVRGALSLAPDESGQITTDPLENHGFHLKIEAEGFNTDERDVNVVNDTTTEVDVELEPAEKTITVTGNRTLLKPRNTTSASNRSGVFLNRYPVTNNNPQQLQGIISSVPGVALDSNNQAHVRGEHTQTSVYIGGFQLGGALVGRFGPLLAPDALSNIDVQTGSYSPEFGSETAAVLNTTIRSGTIDPTRNVEIGGGQFGTFQGSLSVGGQEGKPVGGTEADATAGAKVERQFRYFLNATARRTDNALEPPQPDNQTANNDGRAETVLGRFDYVPDKQNSFSLILNTAPARTGVANRTGLSSKYAGVGQGYGYGGSLSRNDAENEAGTPGYTNSNIGETQDEAGQDISQKDQNDFGLLQYRHSFSDKLNALVSFGGSQNKLDLTNNNPSIYQSLPSDLFASRQDDPVEFSPNVSRTGKHGQLEGSLSYASGNHTFKFGLSTDQQSGDESYNLVPGSQAALNALYAAAPGLVPGGTPQVDGTGAPVLDANGNQVYLLNAGATVPTVNINRDGYYRAAYLQDTWNINRKFTANYGLRYDMFKRSESVNGSATGDSDSSLRDNFLGPRLNLSYALKPDLIARASYNRLFIQPPLSEGGAIGTQIKPEKLNQYETSLEKQINSRQSVKLSYYYKQIRDQLDIALLVPGSQIGIYSAVNLAHDQVHGLELSYQLQPRNNVGLGGYVSLARATAKFSDPEEGDDYNDHDQRYTLSTGVNYSLKDGAFAGLNLYYGSGVASSAISGVGFSGDRQDRTRVDLRLQSSPKLIAGKGGLRLDVDNLFNDRSLINFGSDFSGTRFQQGRRVVLSAFSSF